MVTNLSIRFSEKTLRWVRSYVHTLEKNFCFYKRSNIRHYSVKDNCRNEGTNNGIKYGDVSVGPLHSLDRSSVILSLDSEYRNENMDIFHEKELDREKTWIDNF